MRTVRLLIAAGATGRDDIDVTFIRDDGTTSRGTTRLRRDRFARMDLEHALASRSTPRVAEAARDYRALMAASLAEAVGERLPLDGQALVVVTVHGGSVLHEWPWEILRHDLGADAGPVIVVRVPESGAVRGSDDPAALQETELVWVGARPDGAADIPRFAVLGGVLPVLADPESMLSSGGLSTDATFADLDRMLAPRASAGARIVHLDAHGHSRVRPGTGALIDAVFTCALRGEHEPRIIEDAELLDRIVASGCALFATNACFGAQQRGPSELPFPAQLVQQGVGAAVAVRNPLSVSAAATFFTAFYVGLAYGHSVIEAFDTATRTVVATAPGAPGVARDEALRLLLQPVLWLRGPGEAHRRLQGRIDRAVAASSAVRALAALAVVPGTMAELAERVEDATAAGHDVDLSCGDPATSITRRRARSPRRSAGWYGRPLPRATGRRAPRSPSRS